MVTDLRFGHRRSGPNPEHRFQGYTGASPVGQRGGIAHYLNRRDRSRIAPRSRCVEVRPGPFARANEMIVYADRAQHQVSRPRRALLAVWFPMHPHMTAVEDAHEWIGSAHRVRRATLQCEPALGLPRIELRLVGSMGACPNGHDGRHNQRSAVRSHNHSATPPNAQHHLQAHPYSARGARAIQECAWQAHAIVRRLGWQATAVLWPLSPQRARDTRRRGE